MIKYSLRCDHDHVFEVWFRNNDDCEAQMKHGHVECPVCSSTAISKSLMSPKVSGTRSQNAPSGPALVPANHSAPSQAVTVGAATPDQQQVQHMLRAFRDHVVQNADYVGDKFAEEARKIHFKESEKRGIYGEASVEDAKSLAEDGIDCLPLPSLPEDKN
ncbi:DUF1178 family protein [uncultured Cohaesibacter sp.]|uniref:DUF1178 family protein n=1 Tax=uncultured Cohaesibacter sp. TaxID=1002546 RepID=UPI00292FD7FC|nr:DUF1178 family protein [uncultured Cohaesibacter sp.]